MTTWGNTVPSQAQVREKKREALVKQAAQEFRRRGYHATSMDDIAASLGVSKAALYRYVKSKDEVLYECFKHAEILAKNALKETKKQPGQAVVRLRFFVAKFIRDYLDSNLAGGAMIEIGALLPHQRDDVVKGRDEIDGALKDMLKEGMSDGSIAKADTSLIVLALMGSINWIPSWFREDGKFNSSELAELMADILVDGVKSRK
ncbi:TetR/AcrR family transcriptional regulator [Sneathiella sp. HT1-7]|uniref:TetR/AcrR family transcriptional regulator n=1 Tax=Sneathiella sp. HT1-7 TaxID=2887192 RepID=UPI001D152C07|nr:TetR/AcrR family transcriptional regulator [Sneathiella sp. HT1-7]MCC3306197.1 TetR/AcrR family transcriptional regulator [Sneathiella sp. HT1-7]